MKARPLPWLAAICTVIVLYRAPCAAADFAVDMPAALRHTLESGAPVIGPNGKPVPTENLAEFYAQRQGQPLWVDPSGLNGRGQALVAKLREADRDGLDPAEYVVGDPPSAAAGIDRLAVSEIALSATLLRYANDVRRGRATPGKMDAEQRVTPKPIDSAAQLLTGAAEAADLPVFIDRLAPADPFYRGLRTALDRYRAVEAAGGWPQIGAGPRLDTGSTGPRVRALRQHLLLTGDLPPERQVRSPDRFDEELREGVKRFQQRHGLGADGAVGGGTQTALDVPVGARIRQIKANLERARWLPEDLGDPYVLVNMAAFQLEVVEAGLPVLEMRVVIGERDKETPAFSDFISYIEINPYWNVPRSIAVKEKLPQLRRNPSALAAQNIRVLTAGGEQINPASIDWSTVGDNFPYRLRQDPGGRNALGRIKFMFPNPYDVYMHDTPSRALFNRPVRAFSHGCIRVEKPMELAEFLLRRNGGWSRDRIQNLIDAGKNRPLTLSPPVPVHLIYLTAWLGADGTVQFRDDLYNRDARLVAALDAVSE